MRRISHKNRLPALLLTAALLQCAPAASPTSPEAPQESDSHSVVVCGHLYSLYVRSKMMSRKELVHTESHLEALADELRRIDPEATFFLGDNTRFATEEEWSMLGRIFDGVGGRRIWVAGNHDHREIETFDASGGVHDASFVIGNDKFITLDAKTVFDQEDLGFIAREVANHESFDHVLVMMHYILVNTEEPDEDTDPFKAYTGKSNWNSAVVPLIAGKVDYVFAGDYYPMHVGRMVQSFDGHEIQYIRNSFLFGRGRGDDKTGDGPMIFLELRFDGGELAILPHTVPVDVQDEWYRDFRVAKRFQEEDVEEPRKSVSRWNFHVVGEALGIPFPPNWRVNRQVEGADLAGLDEASGLALHLYEYADRGDLEALESDLRKAAGDGWDAAAIEQEGELSIRRVTAHWLLSPLLRGSGRGLNVVLSFDGKGYLITITLPPRPDDYRQQLRDQFTAFAIVEGIRFDQ